MIGLPDRHHNHYSRSLRPVIPSDLFSRLKHPLCRSYVYIHRTKAFMSDTFLFLSCAISMHRLLYSASYYISCAVRAFHNHISHQHSIIGRRYKESFLLVLGCWVYCTYISAQVDCGAVSIYLLQETTPPNTHSAAPGGLPTRLCNELSVSLTQR